MQYAGFQFSRLLQRAAVRKVRSIGHAMFGKYLIVTNMGTSLALSGLGDVLEQHYEILQRGHEKWDKGRTTHMAITGLSVGFVVHHAYQYIDYLFPGRGIKTVVKKMVFDQIFISPVCISVFFATLAILEKSNFETFREELIHKGFRLYIAEMIVWPPAQFINFYILPLRFRVLYDNTISLGYDVYTSYVKHDISHTVLTSSDTKH